MKKTIAVLCAMLCLVGSAAGCKSNKTGSEADNSSALLTSSSSQNTDLDSVTSDTTSQQTETPGDNGNTGDYVRPTPNLGGKTVTILSWYPTYVNGTQGDSTFGDAYRNMLKKVETELNCKFKWNFVSSDELSTIVINHVASGSKDEDIVMPVLWNTSSLMSSHSLVDLKTVSSVNTSAPYWNQSANSLLTSNGIQRAAIGSFCNVMSQETTAIYFNKRLISELKLENPYDLVNNNQWTVSKLREMAKTATVPSKSQYGIATLDYVIGFGKYVLAANNQQFVTKTDAGLYQYNMSADLCKTIDYVQDWIFNDKSIYTVMEQDAQRSLFRNGQALFYAFQVSELDKFTDMKDDFGIVPFPRGDEVADYRGQIHFSVITSGIPVTVKGDDLYNAGAVLQSMAFHSSELETVRANELKSRYMRDSESRTMFDKYISKCGVFEPDSIAATPRQPEIEAGTTAVLGSVCRDSNQNTATLMSKNKMSTMSAILQFNNAVSK